MVDKWAGSIEIGVTTHNPAYLQLPSTMTNLRSGELGSISSSISPFYLKDLTMLDGLTLQERGWWPGMASCTMEQQYWMSMDTIWTASKWVMFVLYFSADSFCPSMTLMTSFFSFFLTVSPLTGRWHCRCSSERRWQPTLFCERCGSGPCGLECPSQRVRCSWPLWPGCSGHHHGRHGWESEGREEMDSLRSKMWW